MTELMLSAVSATAYVSQQAFIDAFFMVVFFFCAMQARDRMKRLAGGLDVTGEFPGASRSRRRL